MTGSIPIDIYTGNSGVNNGIMPKLSQCPEKVKVGTLKFSNRGRLNVRRCHCMMSSNYILVGVLCLQALAPTFLCSFTSTVVSLYWSSQDMSSKCHFLLFNLTVNLYFIVNTSYLGRLPIIPLSITAQSINPFIKYISKIIQNIIKKSTKR